MNGSSLICWNGMYVKRQLFFCLVSCLLSVHLQAQKDTTKQSINITSSYQPVLRNAVKINFSGTPLTADTVVSVRPYQVPAQNLFYSYQPIALKPLALQQDTGIYLGGRNYVKAGFGNFTTPYVKAAFGLGTGRPALVNFYGSYISSKGKIRHQDYAQLDAGAAGSYFLSQHEVYGSAGFSQHNYFLYGYDHFLYNYKKDDVKQFLTDINVRVGLRNTVIPDSRITYDPSVEIGFLTNVGKLTETTIMINAPVEKKIGDHFAFSVIAKSDFTNYVTKGFIPANLKFNNNLVQVTPAVQYHSASVNVVAGINPSWSNSKFELFPDIIAEVQLKDKVFALQAGWVGHYRKNTYRNLVNWNPYLGQVTSQANTKETEFYGGIKASIGKHFNFNAKAGLIRTKDFPFFINDTATDNKSFNVIYEPVVNIFRLHGDLSFISQESFTATAGVTYNGYTGMKINDRAWNTVPVEFNGSVRWWVLKQLMVKADFYMFGGGHYLAKGNNGYKFDAGTDLSAGVSFLINKHFSAWLDVNNVLNNKYQRWHGYEVYGLNLLGGVRYDF